MRSLARPRPASESAGIMVSPRVATSLHPMAYRHQAEPHRDHLERALEPRQDVRRD